jgi:hypothetical protein
MPGQGTGARRPIPAVSGSRIRQRRREHGRVGVRGVHPSIERPSSPPLQPHALHTGSSSIGPSSVRPRRPGWALATAQFHSARRASLPCCASRSLSLPAPAPLVAAHRARRHRELETWRRGRRMHWSWLRRGAALRCARQWLVATGHATPHCPSLSPSVPLPPI